MTRTELLKELIRLDKIYFKASHIRECNKQMKLKNYMNSTPTYFEQIVNLLYHLEMKINTENEKCIEDKYNIIIIDQEFQELENLIFVFSDLLIQCQNNDLLEQIFPRIKELIDAIDSHVFCYEVSEVTSDDLANLKEDGSSDNNNLDQQNLALIYTQSDTSPSENESYIMRENGCISCSFANVLENMENFYPMGQGANCNIN